MELVYIELSLSSTYTLHASPLLLAPPWRAHWKRRNELLGGQSCFDLQMWGPVEIKKEGS
jgi:hypothetical protein